MITLVQAIATEVAAVAVAGAAICRLAGMHVVRYAGVRHRVSWVLVYMAMPLGAIAAVHEVMVGESSLSTLILLMAVGAYLAQSRHTWRHGPPAFMRIVERCGQDDMAGAPEGGVDRTAPATDQ